MARTAHRRYLEGDPWRGLRRQARRGCRGRQDHGGCGDQRESRTDHPMPPCPQQRAEFVTPSVAHKVEASKSDKAAPSVGGPDPGARARAKVTEVEGQPSRLAQAATWYLQAVDAVPA